MSLDFEPAAVHIDHTFEERVTFEESWVWTDEDGNPVDLSNYTAADAHFRDVDDDSLLLALSLNSGIYLGTTDGLVTIRIDHALLTNLNWDRSVYDMIVIGPINATYPSGQSTKLMYGEGNVFHSRTK